MSTRIYVHTHNLGRAKSEGVDLPLWIIDRDGAQEVVRAFEVNGRVVSHTYFDTPRGADCWNRPTMWLEVEAGAEVLVKDRT